MPIVVKKIFEARKRSPGASSTTSEWEKYPKLQPYTLVIPVSNGLLCGDLENVSMQT